MQYTFLQKKVFESLKKFEERLNNETAQGWDVVGISQDRGQIVVLLKRTSKY